jgi:hypothetical protein
VIVVCLSSRVFEHSCNFSYITNRYLSYTLSGLHVAGRTYEDVTRRGLGTTLEMSSHRVRVGVGRSSYEKLKTVKNCF